MAFFIRSRLFGLLLLLSLPLDCTAALATAAAREPGQVSAASIEERLRRIAAEVRQRQEAAVAADGEAAAVEGDRLAYVFINAPTVGWGNGGFRNGGFYNGGFRNGGFRNGGGWRNGGFRNGGFRNFR